MTVSLKKTSSLPINLKGKRALVIDSIENVRFIIASLLSEIGFSLVTQCGTGAEATSILLKENFDLIITDLKSEKIDGLKLLNDIRKGKSKNMNVPFILTSTNIDQRAVVSAIQAGVSEFIVKPFSGQILIDRVVRAFKYPIKNAQIFEQYQTLLGKEDDEKLSILVVDDEPANIDLISGLLRQDYKVKAATNANLAFKICQLEPQPDLVLLDIMMPEIDGLQLCKRIKKSPRTQHIAVIFLSAMNQTKDIVAGLELGASDYITKPVIPEIVKVRVDTQARSIAASKLVRQQMDAMMEMARLKEEFETVIKSDMKRPLTQMNTALANLLQHSRDPKRLLKDAELVQTAIDNLTTILDRTLLVKKIEDGQYTLEPKTIELKSVFSTVIKNLTPLLDERLLELKINELKQESITGEYDLVLSTLSNVFESLVFSAPRGSVLTVSVSKTDDDRSRIGVHSVNTIPIELRAKIFDKFVTNNSREGTFIGLYAAKLFTEIQHGEIGLTEESDLGTEIYMIFPRKTP